MGFGIEVLNTIRANASPEYKDRIPEATRDNIIAVGNALETYNLLYNEFFPALFGKIGKTIIESKLFENKLARFKSGTIFNQQDVEEMFIEMMKAEGAYDNKGLNPLGRRTGPDVEVVYHRMNRQDYYAITIGDIDVVRVFRSEASLDNFITGLFNSVYSGANYDEYLAVKKLLGDYDGYCDYEVLPMGFVSATEMVADNPANNATPYGITEFLAKSFVKTVRKASQDMTFASREYNKAGVMTWTPVENQVLLVNKDVLAEVDVEVLAKAFNMGKTDIQVEIVSMDGFGAESADDESTKTYGLLVDKDFFRIWDTLSKMEPQRNAQGLFTNYFYHVHQILSLSPFKNAIRFVATAVA